MSQHTIVMMYRLLRPWEAAERRRL